MNLSNRPEAPESAPVRAARANAPPRDLADAAAASAAAVAASLSAHRKDIDGLRAVAVIPVLLFHAGVPGFSGGYVGVDVFFVISGYLITSIIYRELRQGKFTIAKFYERRVRRIFPALFVLLAAVVAAGCATLVPPDLVQLGKSVVATALFASNIFFYRESGYFDTTAVTKPLLHTWSLAVEEQYYILFPVAVVLLYRWRRNWVPGGIVAAMLLSFALSTAAVLNDQVAAFFLPHNRAWELLLGSTLSFVKPRRIEAFAWCGLVFITVAVFAYDQTTIFPGPLALVPCLGAGAILLAADGTSAGRLLSHPILTFTGEISYSLYLWHWPILVFLGLTFGVDHSAAQIPISLMLSFAAATLSWRYVEMPYRRRGPSPAVPLLAGGTAIAFGVAAGAVAMTGLPSRLPPGAVALAAVATEKWPSPAGCFYSEGPNPKSIASECFADGPYWTVIWGDSHALQYAGPMESMLDGGVGLVGRGGCAPVDLTPIRLRRQADQDCRAFNRAVLQHIVRSRTIQTVVLSARWARFTFPWTDDEAQGFVGVADDDRSTALTASLGRTIMALRNAGKGVVVIGPEPEFRDRLPTCLARAAWLNRPATICGYRRLTLPGSPIDVQLQQLQQREKDFMLYRPADALCRSGQCLRTLHGRPVMRDADHFTNEASAFVVRDLVSKGLGQDSIAGPGLNRSPSVEKARGGRTIAMKPDA